MGREILGKNWKGFAFLALAVGLFACKGDSVKLKDDACVLNPFSPDCSATSVCNNPPRIVRTEFDPKTGRVPFIATFHVQAEDDDLFSDCGEKLTYHWDFNGDGVEDLTTETGNGIEHLYELASPDPYKVTIWVTDRNGNRSPDTVKYISALSNRPPIISRFDAVAAKGMLDKREECSADAPYCFRTVFSWVASDPDGSIARVELDPGDGSPIYVADLSKNPSYAHRYTKPGIHHAILRVFDNYGATASREFTVQVAVPTQQSSKLITAGSSSALAFHDGPGGTWFDGQGERQQVVYVADGPISLKSVLYPASAFQEGNVSHSAQLLGMADPEPGINKGMKTVAAYKDLVAVGGMQGLQLFNVNTDTMGACGPDATEGCFPGTPTAPVAVCGATVDNPWLFKRSISRVRFFERNDGEAFLLASTSRVGGTEERLVAAFPVSDALDAGNYRQPSAIAQPKCWDVEGVSRSPFDVEGGLFAEDFAIDEQGNAWFTQMSVGVRRYDLNDWLDTCNPANSYCGKRNLTGMAIGQGLAGHGHHIDITARRAINSELTFTSSPLESVCREEPLLAAGDRVTFTVRMAETLPGDVGHVVIRLLDASIDDNGGAGYPVRRHGSMVELAGLPATDPSVWASLDRLDGLQSWEIEVDGLEKVSLKTNKAILPGNRVLIDYLGQRDDGTGSGYLVTGNEGKDTLLADVPLKRDWLGAPDASVRTAHTAWARLPAYPGRPSDNPVTFSTSPGVQLGRSNQCWNVVYDYSGTPSPGTVSAHFQTAPILVVGIENSGYHVFDILNPKAPLKLGGFAGDSGDHKSGGAYFRIDREKLFLLSKLAFVVDLSDPYHVARAYAEGRNTGIFNTFAYGDGKPDTDLMRDILIVRSEHIPDADNSDGIALIANGFRGLTAVYLDKAKQLNQTLRETCFGGSSSGAEPRTTVDSACTRTMLPALQLAHEGSPNGIALVDGNYAFVAQERGGVAIYDAAAMRARRTPKLLGHIRTADNPQAVRITRNVQGEPEHIFIADTSSIYRFPFTNISDPSGRFFKADSQGTGYSCLNVSGDKVYACWDDGATIAWGSPDDFPASEGYIKQYYSLQNDRCVPDGTGLIGKALHKIYVENIAGRRWVFGSSKENTLILEMDDSGRHLCQFRYDSHLPPYKNAMAYRHVPTSANVKKRLYATDGRRIAAYDIDAIEDEVGASGFVMHRPPLLSEYALPKLDPPGPAGTTTISVRELNTLGPYIFAASGRTGAWVLDASDPSRMNLIGNTWGLGMRSDAVAIDAMAEPDLGGKWTYHLLISDRNAGGTDVGGISVLTYKNLEAPD